MPEPDKLEPHKREEKANRWDKIAATIEDDPEWYLDDGIDMVELAEALYWAADRLREVKEARELPDG